MERMRVLQDDYNMAMMKLQMSIGEYSKVGMEHYIKAKDIDTIVKFCEIEGPLRKRLGELLDSGDVENIDLAYQLLKSSITIKEN